MGAQGQELGDLSVTRVRDRRPELVTGRPGSPMDVGGCSWARDQRLGSQDVLWLWMGAHGQGTRGVLG